MSRIISYILLCVLVISCNSSSDSTQSYLIPKEPNYNDSTLWFSNVKGDSIDVFYITPTCIFDWKDKKTDRTFHHYDVYGEVMKENFDYSLNLANDIFGEECNFYAPYYRQTSLETWTMSEVIISERFTIAMQDVKNAFDYYMENKNNGKSFILAGYSQGAKAVIELVKLLDTETIKKMKAAYAIGYKVTDKDLMNKNIELAMGETDKGVVISYNSVKTANDAWYAVSQDTKACINPVNWMTDDTKAQLNDKITVKVDTVNKLLLVDGYDGGGIEIPALKDVITKGNYHLSELTLFKDCLKENVKKRIK